jgi:anti-sigma factor RsiW
MACEYARNLDAFIDAELTTQELSAYAAHLRECKECAAAAAARMRFKLATRSVGKRFVPTAELRAKIQRSCAVPSKKRWFAVLTPTLAAVAAILLFFGLLHTYNVRMNQRQTAMLIDDHITSLASSNPVDVISTDRHTVKPWFQGKLPFSFTLPEAAGSDFSLIGGSMAYLNQSPGAHLLYGLRQHKISVFIFQDAAGITPVQPASSFTVRTFKRDGLSYTFVSDTSSQDVDRLVDLFRKG